ncbi:MFS transporter [Microbispora sp. CA-135349]|uniref:MFS transporter n=1 Tax=Microbispora sp. CA-135349 TaxID=3239953 RepID=UPI003D8E0205
MPASTTPLLVPPFRGFFLGRAVSLAGSSMTPVALALSVLGISGEAGDLGIVLAAQVIPQLVLTLVGGASADRFSRRGVLVVAGLGAGLTQGAVAAVLLTGHYSLPLVSGLVAAGGVLEAFASPALRGIVPELVGARDLQRANAVLSAAGNAARVLGPAAAGLMVAGAGGGWAIALDALSFVAAAGFFARLPRGTRVPASEARPLSGIRAGWEEFRSTPWIWSMTLSFGVINLVNVGPWQILGAMLTKGHDGEAAWGLVLSARALGTLVMSVVMYRLALRRPLRSGALAGALAALPLLALGCAAGTPALMTCAFVGALGFSLAGIAWDTALQQHVPGDVLLRVCSYDDLLSYAAIPAGQLLVGPAAAHLGGERVALLCGVIYVAAGLGPLAVRSVRDLSARTA